MRNSKVIIALLFSAFTYFQSNASHFLGAEITWECQSNGTYIIQLVAYQDCDSGSVGLLDTLNVMSNVPNYNTIKCGKVDVIDVSPACYDPSNSIECGKVNAFYAVSKTIYKSAPVTIGSTPPANGWYFEYSNCCISSDNFDSSPAGMYIRSVMYPYSKNGVVQGSSPCYDSSPQFSETPLLYFAVGTAYDISVSNISDLDVDSVSVEWTEAKSSGPFPGVSVVYDTSYAYDKPLPTNSVSSGSFLSSLDANTGQLNFKSNSAGTFSTNIMITSYRDNQKISEVQRSMPYFLLNNISSPGICGVTANNPPTASAFIDSTISNLQLQEVKDQGGNLLYYKLDAFAGDNIIVNLTGYDLDLRPTCVSQDIIFTADGVGLSVDSTYGNSNNCVNSGPCATISSLNSGGGFISKLSNNVQLNWLTDTANVGTIGSNKYHFTFRFKDDNCNIPSASEVNLIVELSRSIRLSYSNSGICYGDSVQVFVTGDTTNLVWSPSIGVSNINSASPWLSPLTNTIYTVTDLNSGYSESIEVKVDSIVPPIISENMGVYSIANTGNWDTLIWKLNGAPVGDGFLPLAPALTGTYYIEATSGVCMMNSNRLDTAFSSVVSLNPYAQFSYFDSYSYNASYGMNIKNYSSLDIQVKEVVVSTSVSDTSVSLFEINVYDEDLAKIYSEDSVIVIDNNLVKFSGNFTLKANNDYFIVLYCNGSRVMNLYAPTNWPIQDESNSFYVFNAVQEFGYVQYPSTTSSTLPYIHFITDGSIGISEQMVQAPLYLFPNPVSTEIKMSVKGNYTLLNAFGQELDSIENGNVFVVSSLPNGVYFVKSEQNEILRFVKM